MEIVFLVPDFDAEAERLRQAGAQILAGPIDRVCGLPSKRTRLQASAWGNQVSRRSRSYRALSSR